MTSIVSYLIEQVIIHTNLHHCSYWFMIVHDSSYRFMIVFVLVHDSSYWFWFGQEFIIIVNNADTIYTLIGYWYTIHSRRHGFITACYRLLDVGIMGHNDVCMLWFIGPRDQTNPESGLALGLLAVLGMSGVRARSLAYTEGTHSFHA